MDIIEMTRELGKEIQKSDAYVRCQVAMQQADEDIGLQGLIGEFNLKKLAINNEASKDDRDMDKLEALNKEMRAVYADIMGNEKMKAYDAARKDLDNMLLRIQNILSQCAEGNDPEKADYDPSSCTGNCASCGGCH